MFSDLVLGEQGNQPEDESHCWLWLYIRTTKAYPGKKTSYTYGFSCQILPGELYTRLVFFWVYKCIVHKRILALLNANYWGYIRLVGTWLTLQKVSRFKPLGALCHSDWLVSQTEGLVPNTTGHWGIKWLFPEPNNALPIEPRTLRMAHPETIKGSSYGGPGWSGVMATPLQAGHLVGGFSQTICDLWANTIQGNIKH